MGIIVWAVILYLLVSYFGDGIAARVQWRLLGIVAGTIIAEALISYALPNFLGLALALAVSFGLLLLSLVYWIDLDRKTSLKITGAYVTIRVLAIIGLLMFLGQ